MQPEKVVDHLKKIWHSSNLKPLQAELEELTKRISGEKGKEDKLLDLYGSGNMDKETLFAKVDKSQESL